MTDTGDVSGDDGEDGGDGDANDPLALSEQDERAWMLDQLDDAIQQAADKIANGRIRSESKERVRIKWHRALAYQLSVRRQILNDRDLADLSDRVEALEAERDEATGPGLMLDPTASVTASASASADGEREGDG